MAKFKVISRVAMVVVGAVFLAVACKKDGEEAVVRIYNWSDYIGETTLEDFKKATGINYSYDVYDGNETLDAKLKIGKTGYDVVVPTSQPWFAQQIKDGIYLKLDKSKIPNWKNLDPALMKFVEASDPGNEHGVIYQWGTNGIGYNVKMIKDRMPDAPLDSLDMLFKPEVVSKFEDCGVMMIDSSAEILPIVLGYLGKNPNSHDAADLKVTEDAMMAVRPYVKKFHSSEYIDALASGNVCLVLAFSGDVIQAKTRAEEAKNGQEIAYAIPKEGTIIWFDMAAIPADAPHADNALAFINYVLEPKVMADITNFVAYPNAVPASNAFIKPEILNDPTIYPPPEVMKRLFVVEATPPDFERQRNDAWSRIRAGQ